MQPFVMFRAGKTAVLLAILFVLLLVPAGETTAAGAGLLEVVGQSGPLLVVNSTADPGDGSCDILTAATDCTLREAITLTNSQNAPTTQIILSEDLWSADTIVLSAPLPPLSSAAGTVAIVAVDNDGDALNVAISGAGQHLIFTVESGAALELRGLHLKDGRKAISSAGTVMLYRCMLSGNRSDTAGGAIESSGSLHVDQSTFSGNESTVAGGAIYSTARLYVSQSTFSGNSAPDGAAISLLDDGHSIWPADLSVHNSTFSGNRAAHSAAAIAAEGMEQRPVKAWIEFSTFSDNEGGGSFADNIAAAPFVTVHLAGSILHTRADGRNCWAASEAAFSDKGGTISSDDSCALTDESSLSGTDALLGPLQNNGGPTPTHALLDGSPAIDLIPITEDPPPALEEILVCRSPSADQRDFLRAGGAGLGGDACDSGAFETSSTKPSAVRLRSFSARAGGLWGWLVDLPEGRRSR